MAVLLGQNESGTGTALSMTQELGYAWKFTAVGGTATELHAKWSAKGTATKVKVGIFEESGGKIKAETPLVEVEFTSTEVGEVSVGGFSQALTNGTAYFIALLPENGTATLKRGSTTASVKTSATKHKTLAAITQAQWANEETLGPVWLWATGTEGTIVTGKATGTLLLGGTSKGLAAQKVEGKATGPVLLTGTAKGATTEVLKGKATGAVLLTGTAKGRTAEVLKGKATGRLLFGGTAKGAAAGPVLGKATGTLTLRGTAKGSAKEVTSRRAIIMIFDE